MMARVRVEWGEGEEGFVQSFLFVDYAVHDLINQYNSEIKNKASCDFSWRAQ
jgi:hypothetical protein